MDGRRPTDARSVVGGHPAVRSVGQQPEFSPRTGDRSAGAALPDGVAESRAGKRTGHSPHSVARPDGAARRLFWDQKRMGTAKLVRRDRRDADSQVFFWTAELV